MISIGAAEAGDQGAETESPRRLPGAGHYAVVGLGFAATAIVTVLLTRVARRALAEATGESRRLA